MTPRELYEQMKETMETPRGMDAFHASIARQILRRQANDLTHEKCVKEVILSEPGTDPWTVGVVFSDGELSHDGQITLAKMRVNAHRTSMIEDKKNGTVQIVFYVYKGTED